MRIAVYGSRENGHAKVVLDVLLGASDHEAVGLLDDRPENARRAFGGLEVIGGGDDLARLAARGVEGVVLGFGASRGRDDIAGAVIAAGLALPTLVHPSAYIAPSAELAAGVQVLPLASVGPDARIGRGCLVNSGAILDHDVVLGAGAVVDPGAVLTGRVRVGRGVEIGSGAVLIPDVEVDDDAVVGAGAVVVRPVAAGVTVAGVPARPLVG